MSGIVQSQGLSKPYFVRASICFVQVEKQQTFISVGSPGRWAGHTSKQEVSSVKIRKVGLV